ncbi:MAG: glycosyltransferase [Burkholderiaceae bacterium]|nr:glycosyltransferase [Burkholderiaceae bacterium]
MQRVLLIIPSMAGVGGTERVVDSLSKLLGTPERHVFQATFDAPTVSRHFDSATPIYPLGPIPRLPVPLRPVAYAIAAWRLNRLKKRLGIDVTISNLWGADLISALSGGRDRKIALCHINVVGNVSNRLMVRLRPLVAAVYQRFDRVIAVSETLAQELKALYRLPAERMGHIDNFVDRPDAVSSLPADGVQRFVWCGRFSPEKNVEGLLCAWAGFAAGREGVQLVLLGDGPLRDALQQQAAALGLRLAVTPEDASAQLVFAGKVSTPASYMLGARALLLSSHAEGLPMVVLEALSLGVPVLASDCQAGGVRTALQGHGVCNPGRASAEFTPAGALLPVPMAAAPATLAVWNEVLASACHDPVQWAAWQLGAVGRATHFSSAAARGHWLQAIKGLHS